MAISNRIEIGKCEKKKPIPCDKNPPCECDPCDTKPPWVICDSPTAPCDRDGKPTLCSDRIKNPECPIDITQVPYDDEEPPSRTVADPRLEDKVFENSDYCKEVIDDPCSHTDPCDQEPVLCFEKIKNPVCPGEFTHCEPTAHINTTICKSNDNKNQQSYYQLEEAKRILLELHKKTMCLISTAEAKLCTGAKKTIKYVEDTKNIKKVKNCAEKAFNEVQNKTKDLYVKSTNSAVELYKNVKEAGLKVLGRDEDCVPEEKPRRCDPDD